MEFVAFYSCSLLASLKWYDHVYFHVRIPVPRERHALSCLLRYGKRVSDATRLQPSSTIAITTNFCLSFLFVEILQ